MATLNIYIHSFLKFFHTRTNIMLLGCFYPPLTNKNQTNNNQTNNIIISSINPYSIKQKNTKKHTATTTTTTTNYNRVVYQDPSIIHYPIYSVQSKHKLPKIIMVIVKNYHHLPPIIEIIFVNVIPYLILIIITIMPVPDSPHRILLNHPMVIII